MDIARALIGFEGRLNRKPYWIASVALLVVVLAAIAAITTVAVQTMNYEFATWPSLVLQLVILYPAAALMVKRFQDRGRSGALALLLIVPAVLISLGGAFGFLGAPIPLSVIETGIDLEADGFTIWLQSMALELKHRPLDLLLDWWLFVVTVWFVVELGFFRGTPGPNAYGPDPLEAAPARG